jgi:hypothetical protein
MDPLSPPPDLVSGGGLLRDFDGKWLRGFYRNISIRNSVVAELWALCDGLVVAHNLNIHKLFIEQDAKSIPNPFWVYSLFYIFKKSLFYFNYPLLQNNPHPILYFTIHHIKIL